MINICTNDLPSMTMVPNSFIDGPMAQANGDFVKIYLYLLRCLSSKTSFSISSLADALNCTEADVTRALRYWEKADMLSISSDADGKITEIMLSNTLPSSAPVENTPVAESVPETTTTVTSAPQTKVVPQKRACSPDEIISFKEKDGVEDLFFATQTYINRPLHQTEAETLLYWYEDLSMPVDLIEHLIDSCLGSGHTSFHYMNTIAQNWYSDGIHTVAQAKTQAEIHSVAYYTVMNAMGITGRKLIKDEIDYITKWTREYSLSLDIIKEACTRTIVQTSNPSFKYCDSILTDWHNAGVKTMKDIEPLDKAHKSASKEQSNNEKFGFTARSTVYDDEMMKKLLLSSGE